jgi:hypothetical protein
MVVTNSSFGSHGYVYVLSRELSHPPSIQKNLMVSPLTPTPSSFSNSDTYAALFSLDDLTDYESDNGHVPENYNLPSTFTLQEETHQLKRLRAMARRKQFKDRYERLRSARIAFAYHQTRHWSMPQARRCCTSFKGRPDQVTESRPTIPNGATSSQTLKILQRNGYDIRSVE